VPTIPICNQRLARQHLIEQSLRQASEVVELLAAVQAQDYQGAKWALAQRLSGGASDSDIEKEIAGGAILRTHILRPTWHFVAAADIRWMLDLTGPRVKAQLGYYDRELGLDTVVLKRSRDVFTKALKGGKQLTRAELAQALTKGGVRSDGTQRLAHLVMHAELDGLICSGARRGKQFTYALLDERVPAATKKLARDESLYALGMRYFATRGPATEDDFVWWSGLTKADTRAFIHSAGNALQSETIGGRMYWFRPSGMSTKYKRPLVHLLPNYDEYFIGLKDRSAIHGTIKKQGVVANLTALAGNVVTINGQIAGGWTRTFRGKGVSVATRPLFELSSLEARAVKREVERFANFLEMPLQASL